MFYVRHAADYNCKLHLMIIQHAQVEGDLCSTATHVVGTAIMSRLPGHFQFYNWLDTLDLVHTHIYVSQCGS